MRLKRREPSSARRKAVCQSSGTEAVYMPVTISIENTPLITGLMCPASISMGICAPASSSMLSIIAKYMSSIPI